MRNLLLSLLVVALVGPGCLHRSHALFKPVPGVPDSEPAALASPATPEPAAAANPIVTPDTGLIGRVASYNDAGRFVVIDFPVGHMAASGQRFFLYRQGLKVGEVKVTDWNRDHFVVADLVAGEAQKDDEARDK